MPGRQLGLAQGLTLLTYNYTPQTEGGQEKFEDYIRQWMKDIQELLLESEQLRIESDVSGPQVRAVRWEVAQVEIEYWKSRAARLTLLVEQINSHPCKMTLVTLRAANCKLLKVGLLS